MLERLVLARSSYRNGEQKACAVVGEPSYDSKDLVQVVEHVKPTVLVGAVGVAPNCFTKDVIDALMKVNTEHSGQEESASTADSPVVFALSNPKTQAEITAENVYTWSNGAIIYGCGTAFDPVVAGGRTHSPGQVRS